MSKHNRERRAKRKFEKVRRAAMASGRFKPKRAPMGAKRKP